MREHYPDALIIRLPGLFGKSIKKNFIFDFINVIPFMLKKEKFDELVQKDSSLEKYYVLQDNGFYKVNCPEEDRELLKSKFKTLQFSALNFTDSRSVYQFYNLGRLWSDIEIALENNLHMWHPATEPVSAGEVYEYLTGEQFVNEINGTPANYDYKTIYDTLYGGSNGYICNKETVLNEVKKFVEESNENK